MPGGRLTRQDRRLIAAGLGEGVGYAEIARRIARPTSTVSREVARNGGRGGYRPDQAHRSTARRARRRSARDPQAPPPLDGFGRDPEAARAFVERFAAQMVRTGLPLMVSRVLSCLFTSDSGSLTAAELVQRLQVSPASVSQAVGYLERLDVLRRERRPTERRERYVVGDDVWLRTWEANARLNAQWAEAAREGVAVFGAATPAGQRLDRVARFLGRLSADMSGVSDTGADNALTVLAALVYAARPRTADDLARALGWPEERVAAALRDAAEHPGLRTPVALVRLDSGAYTVTADTTRLAPAHQAALRS